MRFLVDMPLSPGLSEWLRLQGHDALHAAELDLHRAPDTLIIERAKLDGRTVVTADLDYPRLLALAQATEPSLVLFRDGDWSEGDVVRRMADLLSALPESEIGQSIIVLDKNSIRRRRLPIT
ncbi:MAG: DUF5615 family PIN-like protein [Hyphomicrobiaceae bacterium]|nr:DUF5615 family PIN-like protein [Hyphomicrobiaceae bacterium]